MRLWRILFFVLLIIISSLISNYINTQINLNHLENGFASIDETGLFYIPFIAFFYLYLFSLWIVSLIDIFKKEPLFANHYVWEKTKLYKFLKKYNKK